MKTKEQYLHATAFPPMLHLELTGKCNLKCKQCYNDSGCRETIMTPERWTDFAQRVSKDLFSVTLAGGEPLLLGKKLYDLMDVFEENGVWINMISNGFLMDRAAAKRIAEHSIGWIEISIDAPQAAYHDELRGVQGSWQRAVLAASYLASYNVPVILGTCVTPKTLGHLEEMAVLAEQMGVAGVTFSKILISGRAYFHQDELVLSDEETQRFVQEVAAVKQEHPLLKISYATQSVAEAIQNSGENANHQIPSSGRTARCASRASSPSSSAMCWKKTCALSGSATKTCGRASAPRPKNSNPPASTMWTRRSAMQTYFELIQEAKPKNKARKVRLDDAQGVYLATSRSAFGIEILGLPSGTLLTLADGRRTLAEIAAAIAERFHVPEDSIQEVIVGEVRNLQRKHLLYMEV